MVKMKKIEGGIFINKFNNKKNRENKIDPDKSLSLDMHNYIIQNQIEECDI